MKNDTAKINNEKFEKRKLEKLKDELEEKDTTGERTIERMDNLTEKIEELITVLVQKELSVTIPDEIKVSNLDDITEDVQVKNWPREQSVKVINFPQKDDVQKVEIINQKEEKDNLPAITKIFNSTVKAITEKIASLWDDGISVKTAKKNPLYVMQVDEKGAPIGRQEFQIFGGGGNGLSVVGLKDKDGNPVNPATKEGLAEIVQAILGISIPAPEGGATSQKQDDQSILLNGIIQAIVNSPVVDVVGVKNELGELIGPSTEEKQNEQTQILNVIKDTQDTIISLVNMMEVMQNAVINPPYLDKSVNAIRNQVQSGTVSTVGTVTTVGGLTNIDGYQGKLQIINQNIQAWATVVRATIS